MDPEYEWTTLAGKRRVVAWWWAQQQGVCCICKSTERLMTPYRRNGHAPDHPWEATIEHLVPKREGGRNTVGNTRLAHKLCNNALGGLWSVNQARIAAGQKPETEAWALETAIEHWERAIERRNAVRVGEEPPPLYGAPPAASARENHKRERARKAEKRIRDRVGDAPRPIIKVIDEHGYPKFSFADEPARPATAPSTPVLPKVTRNAMLEIRKGKFMPTPAKRTKPVCTTCGSDDVTMDGLLRWDAAFQAWVAAEELQNTDCNRCCGETTVKWIDA